MSERPGFLQRHDFSPYPDGPRFASPVQKDYLRGAFQTTAALSTAAAVDGVWILFELWRLDPATPLFVTAFTRAGRRFADSQPLLDRR